MYGNTRLLKQVAHQVCVGKICGGVDAFHDIIIACNARMKKAARFSLNGAEQHNDWPKQGPLMTW